MGMPVLLALYLIQTLNCIGRDNNHVGSGFFIIHNPTSNPDVKSVQQVLFIKKITEWSIKQRNFSTDWQNMQCIYKNDLAYVYTTMKGFFSVSWVIILINMINIWLKCDSCSKW